MLAQRRQGALDERAQLRVLDARLGPLEHRDRLLMILHPQVRKRPIELGAGQRVELLDSLRVLTLSILLRRVLSHLVLPVLPVEAILMHPALSITAGRVGTLRGVAAAHLTL